MLADSEFIKQVAMTIMEGLNPAVCLEPMDIQPPKGWEPRNTSAGKWQFGGVNSVTGIAADTGHTIVKHYAIWTRELKRI